MKLQAGGYYFEFFYILNNIFQIFEIREESSLFIIKINLWHVIAPLIFSQPDYFYCALS